MMWVRSSPSVNWSKIQFWPEHSQTAIALKDNRWHDIFIKSSFVLMQAPSETMSRPTTYSFLQLRQILIDILEHAPNVCVRFRLTGELWQTHMVKIVSVTEDRILVRDESISKLISIPIHRIIQFELDNKFKVLQPHFHYEVAP
jgi:hypothetical protein